MAEINVISLGLNDLNKLSDTCSLTMKNKSSFNIFSSVSQSILILDSMTTNHMTSSSSHLTSYSRSSGKQIITVVNEDYAPIVGFGSIQLQPSLSLHNVLHVTNMANNLIFIHRLTQNFNSIDLAFGRTLLITKEQGYKTIDDNQKKCLPITKQPQKLRKLSKFSFTTSILDSSILFT
ncbi:hypothetical protein CR513_25079, partial [Mucuna pruriens]